MFGRTARTDPRATGLVALALAAALLAALLPGMARVPVVDSPAGPLAAPAPQVVSSVD